MHEALHAKKLKDPHGRIVAISDKCLNLFQLAKGRSESDQALDLKEPRRSSRPRDKSSQQARRRRDFGHAEAEVGVRNIAYGLIEIRVVEDVVDLRAEGERHMLRDANVLGESEGHIEEMRSEHRIPADGAKAGRASGT